MTEKKFQPSHRITLRGGEVSEVLLVDGAAYTQDEWESETAADYERHQNGDWTFQGKPFAGTVSEIQ